jgi:TatA/E family protein of Tat protein translocase
LFNVGPTELLVILVIALIVFGPNKLPEVGRSIGRGLREFRRASDEIRGEIEGALNLDGDQDEMPPQESPASEPQDAPPPTTAAEAPANASTTPANPSSVATEPLPSNGQARSDASGDGEGAG